MRIKLNCLSCGHQIELGEAYEDYEGEVRCWVCQTLLEIALVEGKLRSIRRSESGMSGRSREAVPSPAQSTETALAPAAAGQEAE